jgi:hypothetical protein
LSPFPLPTWTVERIQLIALDEGIIPRWRGEGGYEPFPDELLKKLNIPLNTLVAELLKHRNLRSSCFLC